jgi:hypothetical protein
MYRPIDEMQMNLIVFLVASLLSSILLGGVLLLSAMKLAMLSKAKVTTIGFTMKPFFKLVKQSIFIKYSAVLLIFFVPSIVMGYRRH